MDEKLGSVGLSEFVANTVSEIAKGVFHAQQESKLYGAAINPPGMLKDGGIHRSEKIEFDLAVTATGGGSSEGNFGVRVLSTFSAGMKQESSASHTFENRIRFTVPVRFRSTKD